MPAKKSAKGRKIGRNKDKCSAYRIAGKQTKNAIRAAEKIINRLSRRGIRPKCQLALKAKISRLNCSR